MLNDRALVLAQGSDPDFKPDQKAKFYGLENAFLLQECGNAQP
jgi:hypothetical protein